MNKPRRFAQTPPRTWFSGVPGVSDIMDNMNVIKRLLSDLGDANRGLTPFNPKKLTETSKDEFAQGPLVAALGAGAGMASALNQYLGKLPAIFTYKAQEFALYAFLIGVIGMGKNPARKQISRFNIDGFRDLMKKKIVFTYSSGTKNEFDVGTFEEYVQNPSILDKMLMPELKRQGLEFNEKELGLTRESAATLEKLALISENVDRSVVAALLGASGLVISAGHVMKLIELSNRRDAADPESRLKPQNYLKERAKSIGNRNK